MTINVKELILSEIEGIAASSGDINNKSLKTSIAIVLLRTAALDFKYSTDELEAIVDIFSKNMKIESAEATDLLKFASNINKDKDVVDECIGILKDRLNTEQKQIVLAMVWKIVHADKKVHGNERDFAFQISDRLGLSEEDGMEARRMVMEGEV